MKDIELAQDLQASLLADVRHLKELNKALMHYWEITKLPSTMHCYYAGGMCEDCRASEKIRKLLRRRG